MIDRSPFRNLALSGALVLTTMGLSCDRNPAQPSSGPGPGTNPRVTTVRLEVATPGSIAPGASAQLKATAVRSDFSVEDVTDRVRWASGNVNILHVTSDGVVTGLQIGEARVNATYQAVEGTRYGTGHLDVLLPGTFKLSGRITDKGVGIAQVTVTVISGVGEGLSTTTDANGSYGLFGVAGRVRLQAKRDGYDNQIEEIDVAASITHHFPMTPDRERVVVSGAYTLTLDMGVCDPPWPSSTLPTELKQRRYAAVVTQQEARLTVTLSGADFIISGGRGNWFSGTIDPLGQIAFALGDPDDAYLQGPFDLVERVTSSEAFVVYGTVDGRVNGSDIQGALTGVLMVADAESPSFFAASATCYSRSHRFELRRQ